MEKLRKHSLGFPWWLGFGLSLFLPCCTLSFLLSGPHTALAALAWTAPVWLLIAADRYAPDERRPVPATAPVWFFDGLLYLLAGLQMANIAALGWMVAQLEFTTFAVATVSLANLLATRILAGTNSCCAGIAPAHELLHRRQCWQRWLGRLMLMSVGYDHFFITHRHSHHAHLGSPDDPSTARTSQSYEGFFRESTVRQWHLARQHGRRHMLAGLVAESAWLLGYAWVFGPLALGVWAYQAVVAVRLLEAVNYFQHFGLTLDSERAAGTAWASDSAVSLFLFLGLNRHADHHRRPALPYPQLIPLDDGPRLPYGYLGMALWVKNRNAGYRAWAMQRMQSSATTLKDIGPA